MSWSQIVNWIKSVFRRVTVVYKTEPRHVRSQTTEDKVKFNGYKIVNTGKRHYIGLVHLPAYKELIRKDPCAYCNGPGGTIDHVIPSCHFRRIKQPAPGVINLAGACQKCNNKKGDRSLIMFLLERNRAEKKRRRKHALATQNLQKVAKQAAC